MEVVLFRARVVKSDQPSMWDAGRAPETTLRMALDELPSAQSRKRVWWHVGDITPIDDDSVYFRFGRTADREHPRFDKGHFYHDETEWSPYTEIFADTKIELFGIRHTSKLANRVSDLANRLAMTLSSSSACKEDSTYITLSLIRNPDSLISDIQRAYSISRFQYQVFRPNLDDLDEDFVKPAEKMIENLNGEEGNIDISSRNNDLHRDVTEGLVRQVAASGADCKAQLKFRRNGKTRLRRLKGRPTEVNVQGPETQASLNASIQQIRRIFDELRSSDVNDQ